MTRLREEFDSEAVMPRYAAAPTECNPNQIDCSACGRTVYADKGSYESYVRSLRYDPANQFICDDCNEAALYEHR